MRKYYPILFFLGVTILFFAKFIFLGKLPIPSDTIIGLYHPYRDIYAAQYPNGIPVKNPLTTDPVRQQYPWRNLAISVLQHSELPLWNPYNFAGAPLLANFQTGAFYPLNILFLFLPFAISWSVLIMMQPLLAGIFLYYFLRRFSIHPLAAILGSVSFMFCGFSVAWMQWGTIMQTGLWLPLVLLAKEHLLEKRSSMWMGILILAECSMLFAGHLQTFFYAFVISIIYVAVRIFQYWKQDKTNKKQHLYTRLITFSITGSIVILITAIQWLPTAQFILLSARSVDQANWQKPEWFIQYQHLLQFIAPDFFGNPTTLNYWGVWNYGEFIGYIGIVPLLFAIYAVISRRDKKVVCSAAAIVVSLLFTLPTFIAKIPFIFHLPFLSSSQPTRLLFVIDFALACLSALGADYYVRNGKKIIWPFVVLGICFSGMWLFVMHFSPFIQVNQIDLSVAKRNILLPTIIFISSMLLVLTLLPKRNVRFREILLVVVLLLTIFDLYRFFDKFIPFTPKEYLFPNTKTISFLKNQPQPYRIMATDSRIFPPNFAVQYGIESIEGYDPLYLQRYGELIISSERGKPDLSGPFGFNRIITPHNYNSPIIDLLNVAYVVSLDEITSQKLVKVFQEGQTKVYKNTGVMERAFFVDKIISSVNKQQSINTIFKGNLKNQAVVEGVDFSSRLFTKGKIISANYEVNSVELHMTSSKESFLVLTDMYYPGWKATIDSTPTKIYQTDYTFRGVIIPPGDHTIRFNIGLL